MTAAPDTATMVVLEIAKAYNLTGTYPLRHPTVQDVLRQVGRLLDALPGPFTLETSDSGLRIDGMVVEDHQGHIRELGRALHHAGVTVVRLTPDVRSTDAERLLAVLRDERAIARAGGIVPALQEVGGSILEIAERGQALRTAGVQHAVAAEAIPGSVARSEDSMFDAIRRREVEAGDIVKLAEAYARGDASGRAALAPKLKEVGTALRQAGEAQGLAQAVAVLAGRIEDDMDPAVRESLYAMVVELTTPQVARRLAVELGQSARDEERRDQLIRVLTRIGVDAAHAVAEALGETEDRPARRAYIDALVKFGRMGMPLVEGMLADPRWFVVRNAVMVLGEVGGPQALAHLTATLAHGDSRVRRETVTALTKLGSPDAERLLLGVLDDPHPDVRSAATLAVSVLKVDRAVKPLLERLSVEDNEDAQIEIIRALGRIGDAVAVPAIEKFTSGGLFSRTPVRVRLEALRSLGAIGTPHALQVLERAANARNSQIRETARAALRAAEAART
ncbi:MAG: HEAT repeat domain-containing protein [Gemmatimonadetes bacterium]|nr:HEAT repeat domain-containing protein [Gemmatimonadota bacterium]